MISFKMLDQDSDSSLDEDPQPQIPQISPLEFAELMDVEYGVDEYFEPEELEQMSHIELRRYKNLRANYEVMKAMGKDCSIYCKWGCMHCPVCWVTRPTAYAKNGQVWSSYTSSKTIIKHLHMLIDLSML